MTSSNSEQDTPPSQDSDAQRVNIRDMQHTVFAVLRLDSMYVKFVIVDGDGHRYETIMTHGEADNLARVLVQSS